MARKQAPRRCKKVRIPPPFEKIEAKIFLKLTVMQRGIIQKLVERNKTIETEVLLAIMGLKVKDKYKTFFPEIIFEGGQGAPGNLNLVLPRTLLNQLLKNNKIKIKNEPI